MSVVQEARSRLYTAEYLERLSADGHRYELIGPGGRPIPVVDFGVNPVKELF